MKNNKIVALLTDFGTKDYFVGAMKGVILSVNPNAKIVDITHEILPQDIRGASFTLRACYKNFPSGTIFVCVVDPGVGSHRRAILVETAEYFFIAPDNGILSFVFEDCALAGAPASDSEICVFELTNDKYFAAKVSATFHGRDIFAPVAAHLSRGVKPNKFGTEIVDFKRFVENKTQAEIIHIDRFGNLITNLKKEDLPEKFALEIGGKKIETLQNFYAEAEKSEVFMIFGSAFFLEIVAFQDSAQEILNAEIGQKITVKKITKS